MVTRYARANTRAAKRRAPPWEAVEEGWWAAEGGGAGPARHDLPWGEWRVAGPLTGRETTLEGPVAGLGAHW